MQTNIRLRAAARITESGLIHGSKLTSMADMGRFSSLKGNFRVPPSRTTPAVAGFSLVEVVLAIGVVSFAFLSVFGLVPIGMNTFRASTDTSVGTRISQQVVNEVQETDFNTLLTAQNKVRYFNVDGQELTNSAGATSQTPPPGTLYQVNTRVLSSPLLPGADNANPNLATVTVQIANNPGNQVLQVSGTSNLWTAQPGVSVTTYSTVVSGYLATSGT